MNWRLLLFPFSILYDGITRLRNLAFNNGILKSQKFDIPIISIGNLSTGGTGKTPMVEFLIENLHPKKIGVVSRGYGRKTNGLLVADEKSTAETIGDEPFQIFQKFPEIKLAVAEKRAVGISALMEKFQLDVILLDDAFQHRWVKPKKSILLTTFQQPLFRDLVLPVGNLRESSKGKNRADVIVVTKCPPELNRKTAEAFKQKMGSQKPIFFTSIGYDFPRNKLGQTLSENGKIAVITGVANPELFLFFLKSNFLVARHWNFSDHHNFSVKEISEFDDYLKKRESYLVTTEKDFARLQSKMNHKLLSQIFHVPIQTRFLFHQEEEFLTLLK